ncbi:cyclic pyranopterin monophosphate synthase MoaC [Aquisalimonas asiatica]|uniref:Cyclic pyranopterin monophosphate synthase n=1 Tax=Aquisalimonas asiatica TaxID=406100 RepID=A0A1H8Q8C4_9GAMM|nr:cyclic pyranopterin monophosphate synthase MoaC [Aquisalimonas asiatica]SEO50460.1 cyclic pyranopterin monophosphate synthase subunit MoaC [Aquisalimonas asiatica]
MSKLPHLNETGEVHIVNVGEKDSTRRVAVAEGRIHMEADTLAAIREQRIKKGDVLAVARVAGLMASKKTWETVPLCHPIQLTHAEVTLEPLNDGSGIHCTARTETVERTGVEMEALNAVQAALLTVYDMCKGMDRGMTIDGVRLMEKSGGRSGKWEREGEPGRD